MSRPRPGVGSELLPVALILVGLAGTLGLVIAMHRRAAPARPAARPPQVVIAPETAPDPARTPAPPPKPERAAPSKRVVAPQPPPPPAEDPTRAALARLSAEEAEQHRAAREADRKAEALEAARQAAVAESLRRRRREALVRGQVDRLAETAQKLEQEADALAMERDALAMERDAAKAELARARVRGGGYAVLPHKGPNGTWQRPVVIECRNGVAILQPRGLTFTMVDMSPILNLRSSPMIAAVARELMRVQESTSPDGAPVVPYIYFVVRPDGVRPYYEARGRLERLGIAFGYELVDQDWDIEFPNVDDLASWDGSVPPRPSRPAETPGPRDFVWPVDRADRLPGRGGDARNPAGNATAGGSGNGNGRGDGQNPFLWPTRPPGDPGGGDREGTSLDAEDLARRGGYGSAPGGSDNPGGRPGPGRSVPPGSLTPGGMGRWKPSALASGGGAAGRPEIGGGLGTADGAPGASPTGGPGGGRGPQGAPADGSTGLIALSPDGLPGFDRAGGTGGGDAGPANAAGVRFGTPTTPRSGQAAGSGSNMQGGTPAGELGLKPAGSGDGAPPALSRMTPPGRLPVDPTLLAEADEAQQLLDRLNEARRNGGPGSTGSPGSAGPSGSSDSSGSPTTTGAGRPSAGGGGSDGQVGVGMPSLGASAGQRAKSADSHPTPSTARRREPTLIRSIEVPLDLVVACGRDGVIVHPGGYRLSINTLKKDGVLARDLAMIVRNHELVDPNIRPKPRVQFLVEPGGGETYELARRKTVLSGLSWPVTLKVAESSSSPRVFPKERY